MLSPDGASPSLTRCPFVLEILSQLRQPVINKKIENHTKKTKAKTYFL